MKDRRWPHANRAVRLSVRSNVRPVVVAVSAALAVASPAGAITVLPDRGADDVLEGVTVTIPPGARPLTSPRWIALKLVRMSIVADASLTSLRFCRDFAQRCIAGVPDELPSGAGAIWVARFAGAIPCCPYGPPGRATVTVATAYFLVADETRSTFAFGTP